MPTIVPIAPEAKGIGKFGDVPVGTYTGVPDISIPIYTVKAGKLSLPITLSYHATGIEVAQEATWVGLGWNLIAGGSISYVQVGGDDRSGRNIIPSDFQRILNYVEYPAPYVHPDVGHEDWFAGWNCTPQKPVQPQIVRTEMMSQLLGGLEEQDVYSANFLNYSYKFIKHPINGSYFFMGQKNKCKIEDCSIIDSGHEFVGFVITGEDGTIYRFESIEKSTFPTSWLLTKIISATGDTISLKYKQATIYNLATLSESYTMKGTLLSPNANRNIVAPNPLQVLYLDTIETRNELVVFESYNNRNDLTGAFKLTRIAIKDKVNQIEKFSYRFAYNYFNGNNVGGDYLNDEQNGPAQISISESYRRQNRLRLDSLIQVSANLTNDKYAFSYYESKPLPYKTSFAMDHWGYYNGQDNKSTLVYGKSHTIVPNPVPLIIGNPWCYAPINYTFCSLNGAIRGASKDSTVYTAGMLKSIQYPTKGKTVFTYEPHDYSNYKFFSAEEEKLNQGYITTASARVQVFDTTFHTAPNVTQSTFMLATQSWIKFSGYTDDTNGSITIEGPDTEKVYHQYTGQAGSNGHVAEWNEDILLNPGTYTLRCTTPIQWLLSSNKMPLIAGQVLYGGYYYTSNYGINHIGGGLRVKSVISYDENNNIASSKKYSYVDESGNTSGYLLIPLNNFNIKNMTTVGNVTINDIAVEHQYYTAYILYGSSYVSLSGFSTGNNVGYNRVVVESYNSSGGTNGKEIDYYDNYPGSLYFAKIPFFLGSANGSLLKKNILNANGDTLLTEKNNYAILPGSETSELLNAYAEDYYDGPSEICFGQLGIVGNACAYIGRYNIYVYPTRNYYNALFNKETTHYFPNGKVKETTNYNYNPNNYCVRSVTESTSKGVKFTNLKYPVDYSDDIHTGMVYQNQLNNVVEKVDSVDANSKYKVKTNHALWYGQFFAPKKITTTKGNVSEPGDSIMFDLYDKYGNIEQVHKNVNMNISYLWGYNHSLPVAKIENASYKGTANVNNSGLWYLNLQQFANGQYTLIGSCTITEAVATTITRSYGKPNTYGVLYNIQILNSSGATVASFYDGLALNETTKSFTSQCNLPAGQYTAKVNVSFNDLPNGVSSFPGGINVSVFSSNGHDAEAPYYNSFEEDVADTSTTYSRTGNKSHLGSFTFTMPTNSGQSVLSYWKKQDAGSPWVQITQTITASGQSMTIGSTGTFIDEVRVYPEGSLMTTYTYDPVFGMTSSTDPNSLTTYYEYDSFGRLKLVKDKDGKILKTYDYHYSTSN